MVGVLLKIKKFNIVDDFLSKRANTLVKYKLVSTGKPPNCHIISQLSFVFQHRNENGDKLQAFSSIPYAITLE